MGRRRVAASEQPLDALLFAVALGRSLPRRNFAILRPRRRKTASRFLNLKRHAVVDPVAVESRDAEAAKRLSVTFFFLRDFRFSVGIFLFFSPPLLHPEVSAPPFGQKVPAGRLCCALKI